MRLGWLLVVSLVSCVPSQSSVFHPVDRELQRRLGTSASWGGPDASSRQAIESMLGKRLDVDAAVRIALAQNRRLQAEYEGLGIAASQIADATVLGTTSVDFNHKFAIGGGGGETELTAIQDVLSLLQIGQRRGVAKAELAAAQARAIDATVMLVAKVEMAYYDYVAAQQDLKTVTSAFDAADAAATLVERQHAAGNTTDLALVREQEQRQRLEVEVKRAAQLVDEQRARLGGAMGVSSEQGAWTTADQLPSPPASPPPLQDLEAIAQASNLEAAALGSDAEAAAGRRRLAIVRAFVPELGAGVAVARRDNSNWEVGPAIRVGIPLFDQQQGPRARARAEERRARAELAATRTEAHADVLTLRSRLLRAFDEAHQLLDVVVPLRKRVLEETVLQYNAMNASTFELLMARRDMVDIGRQSIDAVRRYWNAAAEVRALQRGGHAMAQREASR